MQKLATTDWGNKKNLKKNCAIVIHASKAANSSARRQLQKLFPAVNKPGGDNRRSGGHSGAFSARLQPPIFQTAIAPSPRVPRRTAAKAGPPKCGDTEDEADEEEHLAIYGMSPSGFCVWWA
jgi:hypothetical protein